MFILVEENLSHNINKKTNRNILSYGTIYCRFKSLPSSNERVMAHASFYYPLRDKGYYQNEVYLTVYDS